MENKETFFARLKPFLSPSEILKVDICYLLTKGAHSWQTRKELDENGNPKRYFEHLRGTALIAMDELGIYDSEIINLCLLHDSLEDTNRISPEMIEYLFGTKMVKNVKLLTKDPNRTDESIYYMILGAYGNFETLLVKGCDNLYNLRSLKDCSLDFQKKQYNKSRKYIIPLMVKLTKISEKETKNYFNGCNLLDWIKGELTNIRSTLVNAGVSLED